MSHDEHAKPASGGGETSRPWPWWGQFLLALAALGVASWLLIYMPTMSADRVVAATGKDKVDGLVVWGPMFAVLIGITAMTITGIFIFMTFRIDRGAREVARKVAREEAQREIKKSDIIQDAEKEIALTAKNAKNTISGARASVDDEAKAAKAAIHARVDGVTEEAKTAISGARASVDGVANDAKTAIQASADNVEKKAENAVSAARTGVRNAANAAKAAIHASAGGVTAERENLASAANAANAAISAAVAGVEREAERAKEAISAARDDAGKDGEEGGGPGTSPDAGRD